MEQLRSQDQSFNGRGAGEVGQSVEEQYTAAIPDLEEGKTVVISLDGDFLLEMTPVCDPPPESGGLPLVDARVVQVHGESRGAHPEQALRWFSGLFNREE